MTPVSFSVLMKSYRDMSVSSELPEQTDGQEELPDGQALSWYLYCATGRWHSD